MNNYSNAQEGNSLFVTRSASADSADRLSLWIGESVICTCAHHQIDHSRNDEPGHGHCSIRGCRCIYFSHHKVKKPRRKPWNGSS